MDCEDLDADVYILIPSHMKRVGSAFEEKKLKLELGASVNYIF